MKAYFQYMIWMMLFVIIIEMFFPDSSYRKYIKLVLGCILVYTMLSPIMQFIQVDGQDYEGYVKQYQALLALDQGEAGAYEKALNGQQASMKEMYEQSIKAYVEQHFDVTASNVFVTWQGSELRSIDLVVGKKEATSKIGTIHIGEKSNTTSGDEENLKNKIKTCLSDFYNVQVCNIHITVQKN